MEIKRPHNENNLSVIAGATIFLMHIWCIFFNNFNNWMLYDKIILNCGISLTENILLLSKLILNVTICSWYDTLNKCIDRRILTH